LETFFFDSFSQYDQSKFQSQISQIVEMKVNLKKN
jgi:hypothetical protein